MSNKKENPIQEFQANSLECNERLLVLHNDEVNTFEYVIETLVNVCSHDVIQAEQCAFITHYKGKCDVKKGEYTSLKPMREELINKGLKATIN